MEGCVCVCVVTGKVKSKSFYLWESASSSVQRG